MIVHVARRELLGHLRSPRFLVLCALSLSLLATGAYVSARRLATRVAYADALEAMRQTAVALERPGDDPTTRFGWRAGRVSADPALRAVRPPSPASVLALGDDASLPRYWQFGTEGLIAGPASDPDEATGVDATIDFAFIVRVVLSLIALLTAADAVAGEREAGVLRALFAAPVRRIDILLGKYVGGVLTLGVPLVIGATLSLAVLAAAGAPVVSMDAAVRLTFLVTASALYLATMLALGIAISACCREARTAVIALVAVWIAAVIVVPATAGSVARVVRPVTPYELFRDGRETGLRQLESERARTLAAVWRTVTGSDVVPRDGVIAIETRRRYDEARRTPDAAFMRRKRALVRALDDERAREQLAQTTLAARIALLSPAATFGAVAAELAGTGATSRRRWERAAAEQQERLERATFDRAFGTELYDATIGYLRITFQPDPTDPRERVPAYAELPPFAAPADALSDEVHASLPQLGTLLVWGIAMIGAAAVAVTRMEV